MGGHGHPRTMGEVVLIDLERSWEQTSFNDHYLREKKKPETKRKDKNKTKYSKQEQPQRLEDGLHHSWQLKHILVAT